MRCCKNYIFLTIQFVQKNERMHKVIVLILAVLLAFIYGSNVQNINTIWELPDEAGYLFNAAYFSKNDWSSVASKLVFYGYGYSVILIPLFYICKTGIDLIHGAICVNIICIIVAYFLQISVMSRICEKCSKASLAAFAFIMSLQPYMVSNTLKVLCEVFLSMWVWLIAFVLVKCFECRKLYMYVLLGMVTGYIFFIHTRAIVVVGTVGLILILLFLKKKVSIRQMAAFMFPFILTFAVLYCVKQNIMSDSMQITAGDARANVNVINGNFIIQRIQMIMNNIYLYFIAFMGKILYLTYATCGMIFWGLFGCICGIKESYETDDEKKFALYAFIGVSIFLMVVACTMGGAVLPQNFTYIFYSRYYEFVLSPVFFLGLYTIAYKTIDRKRYGIIFLIIVVSGIVSYSARTAFLEFDEIHIDTARIPGFSAVISPNTEYRGFVAYTTMICILLLVIEIELAQKQKLKLLIPLLVFTVMMQSSNQCLDKILEVNTKQIPDWEIAEFMAEQKKDEEIIFADSDFQYAGAYSRMQVLLKDIKLEVIEESEADKIEEGTYYLTYLSASLGKRLESEGKLVKRGTLYGVYVN